jgi:hypothetical protein
LNELIIDDENKKSLALFPVALFREILEKRTGNEKATRPRIREGLDAQRIIHWEERTLLEIARWLQNGS